MPSQTRHESELEVYREEIKRLTKALRKIVVCDTRKQKGKNIRERLLKSWCQMRQIAKQALNPALPEPTNQHLIKKRVGLDKGET